MIRHKINLVVERLSRGQVFPSTLKVFDMVADCVSLRRSALFGHLLNERFPRDIALKQIQLCSS